MLVLPLDTAVAWTCARSAIWRIRWSGHWRNVVLTAAVASSIMLCCSYACYAAATTAVTVDMTAGIAAFTVVKGR